MFQCIRNKSRSLLAIFTILLGRNCQQKQMIAPDPPRDNLACPKDNIIYRDINTIDDK